MGSKGDEQQLAREIGKARGICDRIRQGDRSAVRQARKMFKQRPTDEVRAMLIDALSEIPTGEAPRSPTSRGNDGKDDRRYVPLEQGRRTLTATLRRDGLSWCLETDSGVFHRISRLDEPNPSAHVDKRRKWRVTVESTNLVKAVTERTLESDKEFKPLLGGLPGQGQNRRN